MGRGGRQKSIIYLGEAVTLISHTVTDLYELRLGDGDGGGLRGKGEGGGGQGVGGRGWGGDACM